MSQQIEAPQTKKAILQAAMTLFAQKGYQGLSMRQLAQTLSMTTGVLYHHFRNKDQLYTAMIEMLATQDADSLYAQVTANRHHDGAIAFQKFMTQRSRYFMQILLLVFDHQRYVRDPHNTPESAFTLIFARSLNTYAQALVDVLELPTHTEAEMLLDYLIGSIARAMMQQREPDFSQLPRLIDFLMAQSSKETQSEESK